jgi:hypothetical protein
MENIPAISWLLQEPLLFYAGTFDGLAFRRSAHSHALTCAAVQRHLERHLLSVALLLTVSQHLACLADSEVVGSAAPKPLKHIPLLKRATEPALEERLLKYALQLQDKGKDAKKVPSNV